MISFKELLTEKIDNLFLSDKETREKYVDQVWELLQFSYRHINGIKGSGFNSKEEMINKIPLWKIYRVGDEVKAVMMYKNKSGRKLVASGTDGSKAAIVMISKMKNDEFKTKRAYVEVSDNALYFVIRTRKLNILDDIISYTDAIERLKENGEEIGDKGELLPKFISELKTYFSASTLEKLDLSNEEAEKIMLSLVSACYVRKIGGHFHLKIMLGNIDAKELEY